jgi:hypothetical protein
VIDRHWIMLAERIDEEYASRLKQIAEGFATSFEEYRERVGYLACMRDIKTWSDDIIKSMDVRPPQARTG